MVSLISLICTDFKNKKKKPVILFVVCGQHGKAALHLACENGHRPVADTLLWHKAFVNAKSKQGLSPLHLAAANGFNPLVKLLLETHGAAIDAC